MRGKTIKRGLSKYPWPTLEIVKGPKRIRLFFFLIFGVILTCAAGFDFFTSFLGKNLFIWKICPSVAGMIMTGVGFMSMYAADPAGIKRRRRYFEEARDGQELVEVILAEKEAYFKTLRKTVWVPVLLAGIVCGMLIFRLILKSTLGKWNKDQG